MSNDGRFDVIIIGSGAGGGTLARHLAPSGKRILILERGDWLPRETENWDSEGGLRREPVRPEGDLVRREGQGVPARHPLLRSAARPRSTARRSTGCGRRTSASCSHHDGISPAWPISLRRDGAVLHQGRAAVRGPRRPRRGPDRGPASAQYPFPAADRTSRASSSCPTTSRGPATTRSTRRAAFGCSSRRPDRQPVHPVPDMRRLPVPRPWRSPMPRCSACARRSNTRTSRSVTNARSSRSRRTPPGPRSTSVVVERDGVEETYERRYRGRLGRGGQLGQAPARIGQRPASERPGQRLRPGRPQLHVPQQRGGPGDLEGAEPDDVPEDTRAERLLLRDAGLRVPDGQHPDGRQVATPRCSRARSRSRPSSRRCSR